MIFEPQSLPRLRYEVDNETRVCLRVINLDGGQVFYGVAAAAEWSAKLGRDRIALEALSVIREHMPDYDETRLDVGDMVVFGLPVDQADAIGPALAYDMAGACLEALAEGRLAVVWA